MADIEKFLPFIISRTFKNPARQRNNKFKLNFEHGDMGQGHQFQIDYEAPDEKTRDLLNKVAEEGRTNAKHMIKMRNKRNGWEIVEPLEIQ